ncbi:MAG: HD domain-containing phosphohydrolase [Vicinamibacterales bacterium]
MNQAPRRRSGLHKAYVATVFVLGLAALVDALYVLNRQPVSYYWIALGAMAVASQFWTIRVPGIKAHLSASEVLLFMVVVLFGSAPAVVTIAVDGLLFAFSREWVQIRKKQYLQAAFGLGEPVLSMWAASHVYFLLPGVRPLFGNAASLQSVAFPALAMGAAYFAMNSGLNAVVLSTSLGRSPHEHWLEKYKNLAGIFISSAVIAVVLSLSLASPSALEIVLVAAVISPLVLAVYQFNKLETERQDKGEEIKQMNVSLAETLATMAEEFDEDTSKRHIRGVKTCSLWLAEEMGVTGPDALEALGFAALLHDIGKATIPDSIWQKPSPLTEAEHRLMRTHPAVGARLAGRISDMFRVHVAPIILNHHENWDGSGYPNGLVGEAIPLGARIVQVADCYDALRRKRPYRQPWTHDAAMAIVRERAGSMYDAAVVKAFDAIENKLAAEPYDEGPAADAIGEIADRQSGARAADATGASMPVALRESGRSALARLLQHLFRLDGRAGVEATCTVVSGYLRQLTPATLVVFYIRDVRANDLVAVHASGYGADLVLGLRMPLGKNVSGWVAVNGRSISTDPALDGVDSLGEIDPRFESLLSVPLLTDQSTIGVATLYAVGENAFQDEQLQALELVAPAIAEVLARAIDSDSSRLDLESPDDRAGVASRRSLEELLARDQRRSGLTGRSRAVLCLRNEGDPGVMLHATMAVSRSTRIADLIFRPTDDSLVVLMRDADAGAEPLVLQRLAAALPTDIAAPPSAASPLRFGFACGPRDGDSWSDLLNLAQHRAWRTPPAAGEAPVMADGSGQKGLPWTS